MSPETLTVDQVLPLLAATPERIRFATSSLSPADLRHRPSPDEWSANDVLAHLRACADVRGGAIATILADDHPTIRTSNPRTYMKTTDYPDLEFEPSFSAFAAQRDELLAILRELPPNAWSRSARVVGAGKALEHSVSYYADWIVIHERPHLKQIEHIAAILRT